MTTTHQNRSRESTAGRVHRFGDNVSTDDVIAGKYKHKTIDLDELATHVMENIRPGFADELEPGDVIVAGSNFGCGSSREQAPAILKHAGVGAVLATSFARIFFRNSINIGLPVVVCDTAGIDDGEVEVDLEAGTVLVASTGERRPITPLSPEMQLMLERGGLIARVKADGRL